MTAASPRAFGSAHAAGRRPRGIPTPKTRAPGAGGTAPAGPASRVPRRHQLARGSRRARSAVTAAPEAPSAGEGRRHRAGRLRARRAHEHRCGARRDRARRRGALGGHVGGRRLRVVGRAARHVPRGGASSRIGIAARPRPGRHPPVRPRHGRRRVDRRARGGRGNRRGADPPAPRRDLPHEHVDRRSGPAEHAGVDRGRAVRRGRCAVLRGAVLPGSGAGCADRPHRGRAPRWWCKRCCSRRRTTRSV